jgi:hypothetical protein
LTDFQELVEGWWWRLEELKDRLTVTGTDVAVVLHFRYARAWWWRARQPTRDTAQKLMQDLLDPAFWREAINQVTWWFCFTSVMAMWVSLWLAAFFLIQDLR